MNLDFCYHKKISFLCLQNSKSLFFVLTIMWHPFTYLIEDKFCYVKSTYKFSQENRPRRVFSDLEGEGGELESLHFFFIFSITTLLRK